MFVKKNFKMPRNFSFSFFYLNSSKRAKIFFRNIILSKIFKNNYRAIKTNLLIRRALFNILERISIKVLIKSFIQLC